MKVCFNGLRLGATSVKVGDIVYILENKSVITVIERRSEFEKAAKAAPAGANQRVDEEEKIWTKSTLNGYLPIKTNKSSCSKSQSE